MQLTRNKLPISVNMSKWQVQDATPKTPHFEAVNEARWAPLQSEVARLKTKKNTSKLILRGCDTKLIRKTKLVLILDVGDE